MAKGDEDEEFDEEETEMSEEDSENADAGEEEIEESKDAEEELEEEEGNSDSDDENDNGKNGKEARGDKNNPASDEKGIINTEISEEVKKSYLDYAMSVIVSRALPSIEDGLKPVQRRILYSMNLLGLQSNKQTKKSARIVGDVLGKYHPHGDVAVYEALVRMAQKFSLRYPLVFGQGNFGSVDGDPAAAMRYCITGDSLIVTEKGLEEIDKISSQEGINLKILSKDKKIHNASKWFDSGQHETIKITTDKGYSLAGSRNHPILVLSRDNSGKPIFAWKLLEEVREGDIAVIDRREDSFWPEKEINLLGYWPEKRNNYQHVKILPQNLNEDLAFLLGALISEGFVSQNKIEFCNSDEKLVQEFEDKWKKVFPDSRLHKFNKLPSSYGKKEYYRLECHSRYTIEFLRNIGLLPVKADKKEVPKDILKSPKNIAASFLRAYFEGDRSISYSRKMNELSCCSKSKELLSKIQVLLLRFGIDSIQRFDQYKDINKLLLRGKRNILRFYKEINFFSERKRKKLEFILVNYKKEATLKDFVPFLSDFIRGMAGYSDNEFVMKHNFDRYSNMKQNYQRISSALLKRTGVGYLSLFEYLLTYEYLFDSIIKVEDNGVQRVYSIKVDSDCHSFISNGFISHNTEAKLSPISTEIIEDIDKETVKFVPNFDNSMKEPELMPSKLPNLIINGASGIAVGMATNIPPHNLSEICDAISEYIKNENVTIDELCQIVTGPDFPTGGALSGDISEMYKTGKGRLILRGKITSEESKGKERIVITEIPYMLNKSTLVEQIAGLIQNKKIMGISDLRDESSKGKIRIVLELKKGVNAKFVNNTLYKYTRLQDSFNANFLALVGTEPKVLNLKQIIEEYVKYRKHVVTSRTQYELKKAKERLEIVEGLLIALKHLDEIIAIIKKSREEAAENLMKKFNFTKRQAEAILETKLRQLTALEQDKLKDEHEKLKVNIIEYEKILGDIKEVLKIIAKEVKALKDKYGDERKTQVMRRIGEIAEKDLVQKKDVIVTITDKGYCKRIDASTYKEQKRGGRGIIGNNLATGDFVKKIISCSTHDYLMFFTSRGRVLFLKVYEIPEADRYSKGKALINLLDLKEELVTNIIAIKEFNDSLFMVTKKGFVKKCSLSHFSKPRAGGIRAINLPPNNSDLLIDCQIIKPNEEVLLATKKGQAIRFNSNDVRLMGRASYGVTGIRMDNGDEVVSLEILRTKEVLTITKHGYGKRTAVEDYRKTARGGKGVINVKVSEKTGDVVTTISINPEDKIIITTGKGMVIRTNLDNIRVMGRATQGVRIVKMQDADYVTDLVRVEGGMENGEGEE